MNVSPLDVRLTSSVLPYRMPAALAPSASLPTDSVALGRIGDAPERLQAAPPPAPAPAPAPAAAPVLAPEQATRLPKVFKGYDRSYLDTTVRPQEDFYRYATGGYAKSHPIPADKDGYGVRSELNERIQDTLRDILEKAAGSGAPQGSVEQKIGDFYASGMDTATIEAAGARPLLPLLDRIASIRDRGDLIDVLAELHASGHKAAFDFGASQDMTDPTQVIGEASQGGLSLPGRDYYLKDDEKSVAIRQAYEEHVGRMLSLLGDASPEAGAAAVLRLETSLAKGSLSRTELRDPKTLDHKMDRAQLAELAPGLDWARYFKALGRPDLETINVATPRFFESLNRELDATPIDDWKTYLRWQVLNQNAGTLSSDFEEQDFAFKGGVLSGIPTQGARWRKIARATDGWLGEAVGQKFVERTFPPEAKARALKMVDDIRAVLRERVAGLPWMGEETRKEALAKVDTLVVKVGYPDRWRDYSDLEVTRGPFAENVLRARAFEAREALASIGRPTDRDKWEMTPATVNAYYHPLLNEIVFPAARLQPPFFDMNADDAANYGGTGVTIGHELTHGFDDSGAQFDAQGRLRNWWQPEDLERFTRLAKGVEDQMSEFEFEGQKVDGKLVKGESLADLGGLELAYAALQRARQGEPDPITADGFTPDQRFFLGYALCRQESLRPESAHMQMSTDPHPLGEFRVNGPLSNLPAFHRAFGARPGDGMVRPEEKRNRLWEA